MDAAQHPTPRLVLQPAIMIVAVPNSVVGRCVCGLEALCEVAMPGSQQQGHARLPCRWDAGTAATGSCDSRVSANGLV